SYLSKKVTPCLPRHPLWCLCAIAVAFLALGCGGPQATPRPEPRVELTIRFTPDASRPQRRETWSLSCRPPSGTHPRAAEACAEIAEHPRVLGPARRACPILQTTTTPKTSVRGWVEGSRISRVVRPGCGPAWQELHALLRGS
ncbi:MAG TPA: SSI family serine proteinase inhibitor, partial [Solirubrobacterales bacterium]|nr:SSI family serine proteinase inhibitor [Solirubrobacterales bacterium]